MQRHYVQILDGRIHASSQEVPLMHPGPSQLLVQVRAAGLNRGEVLALRHSGSEALTSLGIEAAGEVVETGPECQGLHVGDRVMGRCKGAFADHVLIDARDAMPIPDDLSWVQAAAAPIATMVVYDMLVMQGHLTTGEWLLITGVSSGVGVAALQMAKSLGARVIGTSGSQGKLTDLAGHGLDCGIPTRQPDFREAVMAATEGHGADLVVNIIGGSVLAECVGSMALQGRLATVGYVDGVTSAPLDLAALHSRRLHLFGVSSKQLKPEQRHAIVSGVIRDVLPLFAHERMRPVIARVFPFAHLADAITYMESNAQTGKIVLSKPI
jgi:NADPH:quinone reductase-like Zn-dependent oxidoreductase